MILLSAGKLVPADGIVLEARDFLVSQAALTGESFPVEKAPGVCAADASLQQRNNAVFLGTSVRSGTAKVLVAWNRALRRSSARSPDSWRAPARRPRSSGACASSAIC